MQAPNLGPAVPHFICPNCGNRSVSSERTAGFRDRARGCANCGFGFLFELLDDYYPAPNAAFFITDQQGRLIGAGRGARELTGLGDTDVIGRPVQDVLGLEFENGDDNVSTALERGVRILDKPGAGRAGGGCAPCESGWWGRPGAPAPRPPRPTSSPPTTTTADC